MGMKMSISIDDAKHPETSPVIDRPSTFDPLYGFPNGRKKREMKVSWEEMEHWELPYDQRDYCAHLLIPYLSCRRTYAPFASHNCNDLRHKHELCELDDYIMRMKEYEREKRLLKRKVRKENALQTIEVENKI